MSWRGHLWTLGGHLGRMLEAEEEPEAQAWELIVEDPQIGAVRLTGRLSHPEGAETILLVLHGVGGCAESRYAIAAARRAVEAGMAVLRINLRGADRLGEDFYHGGLTADLHAVVASPELDRYERVAALGYSLGGHLVLRWCTEEIDRRVRGVAAVCPPLDLLQCALAIDRPTSWGYRRYVLQQLKEVYVAVAARRPVPTPVDEVRRVGSLVRFDDLTVARRHGFVDARDYYKKMSVGPILDRLSTPALIVEAENDPMVPTEGLMPFLETLPGPVEIRWVRPGGHLGFSSRLDLGLPAPPGLESQVLAWLSARA